MFIQNDIISSQKVDRKILELLDEDITNEEFLLQKFQQIEEINQTSLYGKLLKILTHLDFPYNEAKKIWKEILKNQKLLSDKIGRDIGFRVAMLDYFINLNKKIKNPKIIEIKLYVEAEKLVLLDELTGVYNRRYFDNCLERESNQARRYSRSLSIMILDIDNFKKINDMYGHPKGDWVLEKLGEILNRCTRLEDTVCRIGGEEFALLMPETTTENALIVGNKIRSEFSKLTIEGKKLSLSGGLANMPSDAIEGPKLHQTADKALYFAKYSGKNRIISASKEKRNEIRFPANWKISYNISNRQIETVSKDLSIIGISFDVNEKINEGEILTIGIKNQNRTQDVTFKAKVVWNEEQNDKVHYRIGAKFIETSNQAVHLIKRELEAV